MCIRDSSNPLRCHPLSPTPLSIHGIAGWARGAPPIHPPHESPADRVSSECRQRKEHDNEKRCKTTSCRCNPPNDGPNLYSEYPNRVHVPVEQKEYEVFVLLLERGVEAPFVGFPRGATYCGLTDETDTSVRKTKVTRSSKELRQIPSKLAL